MFENTKGKAKIVTIDIETAPLLSRTWGLYDQNIGVGQIKEDWFIMAFAAKEYGSSIASVEYYDQRAASNVENDEALVKKLWKILDETDIVLTQNGDKFDIKKINARFAAHGLKPPSSYKRLDTKKIASKYFGFTSNSLEYLCKVLKTKHQKGKHTKFPGMELWNECLAGNEEAWKEMEKYNRLDTICTEEVWVKLRAWDNSYNPNLYTDGETNICVCGENAWVRNGIKRLDSGAFQRYVCKKCGYETRGRTNLFSKEKKKSLTAKTSR